MKSIDLTGEKIGILTVIKFSHKNKNNHKMWECLCQCGNSAFYTVGILRSGSIKSCGCLAEKWKHREKTSHGMSNTRFYKIFKGIKYRCLRETCNNYKYYGGRGIKISDDWLVFSNFKDDMYKDYVEHCKASGEKNTTIERIDNSQGYNKDNCKWATSKEQASNRR